MESEKHEKSIGAAVSESSERREREETFRPSSPKEETNKKKEVRKGGVT